jgi:preprotein translocase subunit SecB
MQSSMLLEDFYVTRLHIDWRSPTVEHVNIDKVSLLCDYDVAHNSRNVCRYKMDLHLKISQVGDEQADVGYLVEADLVGLFSFPEEIDDSARQILVRVNGVNILYSTFRGVLGSVSGLFPSGKLTLPSIIPQELVQQVEERKRKSTSIPRAAKAKKK